MAIGKYKKGQLQSAIKPIWQKSDLPEMKGGFTEQAIIDAIETKVEEFKKSLIKHKHASSSGSQRSNTILQDVGAEMEVKQQSTKFTIEFNNGGQVGEWIDKGTHPSKYKHPGKKMVREIGFWISGINSLSSSKNKGLAYAIAASILKKGIIKRYDYKGSNWYTEVAGANDEKITTYLTNRISEALSKDVTVIVTKQSNDMLNGNKHN